MLGSSVLEVAIGIVFVYLFLSLISTAINEGIASLVNKRGKNLFEGIKNLLNDPQFTGLAQQIYSHGLVNGISKNAANPDKPNRLPSYMAPGTFSMALLDLLGSKGIGKSWTALVEQKKKDLLAAQEQSTANPVDAVLVKLASEAQAALDKVMALQSAATAAELAHAEAGEAAKSIDGPKDFKRLQDASIKLQQAVALGRKLASEYPDALGNIERAIEALPAGHTRESLLVIVAKTKQETAALADKVVAAQRQAEVLRQNIEEWFNDTMDRVGGWYKRWTQLVLMGIAVVLVGGVNADTIMLAKRFTRDNALRASVVSAAEKTIQSNAGNPNNSDQARKEFLADAEKLNLPLGWVVDANDPHKADQVPEDFTGWLMKLLGLVLSIFAVSLGAPFWFDTLSKFINLRGAGTPPGETKKSAPQPAP